MKKQKRRTIKIPSEVGSITFEQACETCRVLEEKKKKNSKKKQKQK